MVCSYSLEAHAAAPKSSCTIDRALVPDALAPFTLARSDAPSGPSGPGRSAARARRGLLALKPKDQVESEVSDSDGRISDDDFNRDDWDAYVQSDFSAPACSALMQCEA